MISPSEINYEDAIITGKHTIKFTTYWTPLGVLIVNALSTYICYAFGKFACKIMIQTTSFAFPVNMVVPVLITGNHKCPCSLIPLLHKIWYLYRISINIRLSAEFGYVFAGNQIVRIRTITHETFRPLRCFFCEQSC